MDKGFNGFLLKNNHIPLMNMDVEILKDIPGYEGIYAISNFGRVWSYYKDRWLKGGISCGCRNIVLYKEGKIKGYTIHRLVANMFLEKPNNKNIINHKDGNRLNNYYRNLEWCTYSENNIHAIRVLHKENYMIKTKQLSMKGELIAVYNSRKEASEATGINSSHIVSCCIGRYGFKSAGGFRWEDLYASPAVRISKENI